MATSDAALPPMAKISMIGLWIETVLYGVNCVMYGLCMYVLLRSGKIAPRRWVLVVMSTTLFLLCTIHIGASLRQLLEAFVYAPADVSNYPTIYWLNFTLAPRRMKDYIYDTLLFIQDMILIWRLYVIFLCNWRVVIFPIILAVCRTGSTYAASSIPVPPDTWYGPVTTYLIISAWACEFTLNLSVTGAIAGRFWWMSRTMASLTATSANRFSSSIYLVIESGALSAIADTVALVLFASNSPAALAGLDVVSQVAALVPLLIVVQVGLTGQRRTHDTRLKTILVTQGEITFAENPRGRDPSQDVSLPLATPCV